MVRYSLPNSRTKKHIWYKVSTNRLYPKTFSIRYNLCWTETKGLNVRIPKYFQMRTCPYVVSWYVPNVVATLQVVLPKEEQAVITTIIAFHPLASVRKPK